MRFNWSVEKKNPMFYFVASFILGMIIGGWGWDKNDSTIPARTHGGLTMMIVGSVMIVGGLLGMFLWKGKSPRK